MRIEKCWFCSSNVYPGHGKRYVRNDATTFIFCRSKCLRAFKLKRNPRKLKWTKISRQLRSKDLQNHEILQFERRMDEPKIYDRKIMENIVSAIPNIAEKKSHIENEFIIDRILSSKEVSKSHDIKFIENNERLLYQKENAELIKEKIATNMKNLSTKSIKEKSETCLQTEN